MGVSIAGVGKAFLAGQLLCPKRKKEKKKKKEKDKKKFAPHRLSPRTKALRAFY